MKKNINTIEQKLVFHPGIILKDELKERNITQTEFAKMIKRPPKTISLIIQGKKSIIPETALDFEEALNISAEFWLKMQAQYDLFVLKNKLKERRSNKKNSFTSINKKVEKYLIQKEKVLA